MKKLGTYLLYGGALVFAVALVYMSFSSGKKTESSDINAGIQENNSSAEKVQDFKPAQKIQVFLFHETQRCYSCITIGKFAKETVEQKFSEELKSGKIEFREINIDLPENKEIAEKFKATGSLLFINSIVDGEDSIQNDVRVWQLVSNRQAFMNYLSDKLKGMLGSDASAQEK